VSEAAQAHPIRAFRPDDVVDLYRVCLATGDAGADASALHDDPELLGHLYVGPYAALEPEHVLVLEAVGGPTADGAAGVGSAGVGSAGVGSAGVGSAAASMPASVPSLVAGYAVGALDTLAFHARVRARWLPPLQRRYPDPGGDPERWTPDQRLMHLLHHPDKAFPRTVPEAFGPYPSHLHIDLLPIAQGRGHGRALMERLLEDLRRDGSAGVHLGVAAANARAIGFYEHLGFIPLGEGQEGHAVWMGKRLR